MEQMGQLNLTNRRIVNDRQQINNVLVNQLISSINISLINFKANKTMQQLSQELKTMIHHILYRYKFYRMTASQLHQLLELLNQPQINNPNLIQQYVFRGIVAFNQNYKDKIAPVISNPLYRHISLDSKAFLHKIMHEFHFLNSIKAYQMFQQRYQQPASLSLGQDNNQNLPFDDQFQKARLHYMYYGPYSIYHMSEVNSQLPLNLPTQFPFPINDPFPMQQIPKRSNQSYEQKPINLIQKSNHQKDMVVPHQQIERHYAPTRGRPPKDKRKLLEKQTAKIPQQLKQLLRLYHKEQQIMIQRQEMLQYCICRGYLKSHAIFTCNICNRQFHTKCCNNDKVCLGCKLKIRDPFHKTAQTVGLFYLDWWQNFIFQEQINMKSFANICATGRFQIMLTCILAGQTHITYPDNCRFRINGESIFTVPPILNNHSVKRRKDASHLISSYIFQSASSSQLQKTKFSLQALKFPSNSDFRDNRKGIFLLGIFLVEKINVEDLYISIVTSSLSQMSVNPLLNNNKDQQIQVESMSISCFDPYTKRLMQTPARGQNCLHANCFDLKTFLTFQHNSLERLWLCPICKKQLGRLMVDKFQLRILQAIKSQQKFPLKVSYHLSGKIDLQQGTQQMCQQSQQSSSLI